MNQWISTRVCYNDMVNKSRTLYGCTPFDNSIMNFGVDTSPKNYLFIIGEVIRNFGKLRVLVYIQI